MHCRVRTIPYGILPSQPCVAEVKLKDLGMNFKNITSKSFSITRTKFAREKTDNYPGEISVEIADMS